MLFIFNLSSDANLPLLNPVALIEALDVKLSPNIYILAVSLISVASFGVTSVLLFKKNKSKHDSIFFITIFLAIYAINSNFFIIYALFNAPNLSQFL